MPLEKATKLDELNQEMLALDKQIIALKEQRHKLHNERCALRWGYAVGDTIRNRMKGTTGIVIDFETYWPLINKLRKNGTPAVWPTRAHDPEQWEKV